MALRQAQLRYLPGVIRPGETARFQRISKKTQEAWTNSSGTVLRSSDSLMNLQRQHGRSEISLSSGAEVQPSPAPAVSTPSAPEKGLAGSQWLNLHGSNGATNGNKPETHFHGGLWVQIAYTLIDICCIVVNGGIAYSLRFSPDELWSFITSGHFGLTVSQVPLPYGGFLFLYVALILLF